MDGEYYKFMIPYPPATAIPVEKVAFIRLRPNLFNILFIKDRINTINLKLRLINKT